MQLPISASTFGKSFLAGKGKLKLETADDAWGALLDSEAPFGSKTTDVALVSISAGEDAEDLKLGQPKGLQMTVSASGSVAGSVRLIRKADDPLLTSPELKELLRQGKFYVALELNGSAAGSAKGSYVAGPLTPTFGLKAGGTVGYTRLKLHDASTSARDILRDLFKGVRLPASLEKPSDVPDTGELLVFRCGGYLDLAAGVRWGYSLSGLRSFEVGKLDLALAYAAEFGAHLDLHYRLAGDFDISAEKGHEDGWVRLAVRKSRSSRFDVAADIGVDAELKLEGLPADPNTFLGALLGTDVESFVALLDEATNYTDIATLRKKVDALAWGFIQKRADEWLGKALDNDTATDFFAAVSEVVDAYRGLDARIARLVEASFDNLPALRKGLEQLASLTSREGFAGLSGSTAWKIVDALVGDRFHDLLLDDDAFAAFRALVERARKLVEGEAEKKLLSLIVSIRKDYHLDTVFDALGRIKSAKALREVTDEKLKGIVERLVGKAFDEIAGSAAGEALKQVNGVLAKLEGFKKAWYDRLQASARQSFTAKVAYAYSRASREARLLDLEINLGREEGADLLRRAAGGSFAKALQTYDPDLVLVRQAVLTHQLERSASLRVNVYGWEYSSLTRLVQDFEHAIASDPSGLVHVYTLKTLIEQKKERGRRFKESADSTFLLAAVGLAVQPAGLPAPVDERTGAFLIENLRELSVQYDLVLRDQQTSVSELTDYLALGERLGLVGDAVAAADQLRRDFPDGLGEVRARYVVRYDDAGIRAAFTLPTVDVERIARAAARHFAASELIGDGSRPWTAPVGFAYQNPSLADVFYNQGYTAILKQAWSVKLPAWYTGGQPRDVRLVDFQRQVLVTLYSIEHTLVRRLADLDRLIDRCLAARIPVPVPELQQACRGFVGMADDLDKFAGQNAFFGVFDAIVQAGSNGKGRRESALVLEITPPGANETVTRVLMGGEPTLPGPASA